ncbi:Uncharacterised protein [Mycobacteroides abscessus subsp. abscessus]|uniref:hypothetical protein n=1 Tax=Mycobacteroides abscessus TaxID=36809 RepID=UPI00092A723F|nr:hypothetical protein [Mycobacteroides abscessus]SIC55342.1 Uncharacterised protein [Mycobacteroides abscessus subsp. abscessus]SKU58350.1 Uncharacterised protein [Mycobacteroides abscessus subsp. abscessus]
MKIPLPPARVNVPAVDAALDAQIEAVRCDKIRWESTQRKDFVLDHGEILTMAQGLWADGDTDWLVRVLAMHAIAVCRLAGIEVRA